jgi:hypothetical protein
MTALIQDHFEATMVMECPELYWRTGIIQIQMKAVCGFIEALDGGAQNKLFSVLWMHIFSKRSLHASTLK